jgi:hypothetical protein
MADAGSRSLPRRRANASLTGRGVNRCAEQGLLIVYDDGDIGVGAHAPDLRSLCFGTSIKGALASAARRPARCRC